MLTARETQPKPSGSGEGRRIEALAALLRDEFGVAFRFFDADGFEVCTPGRHVDGAAGPPVPSPRALARIGEERQCEVVAEGGFLQIRLPFFNNSGKAPVVAVGNLIALAGPGPAEEQERTRILKWARRVFDRFREVDAQPPIRANHAGDRDRPAWATLFALDQLLQSHRVHQDPTKVSLRILEACAGLIGARSLIWAPTPSRDVQIWGETILSPWDCGILAQLISVRPDWRSTGYLLCNDQEGAGWRSRFPMVTNLLAIPVRGKPSSGWLIAVNKGEAGAVDLSDRREVRQPTVPFRSTDAALLMPFASMLGLGIRAFQRHQGLKDLLVGLTRSLTSAIDAKDTYTYGHSERVARIAVVLGRGLGLPEQELSDIYLAGLLHDIGKIGIRDAVLCKQGPLSPEEFEHVKQHVTIGHRILSGLESIDHLLPGVLYHHERFDGAGYPEGLSGEGIPLLARIIAVADGFDAMSTSRPYRDALPCGEVEKIMLDGANIQWDRNIVGVLFRSRAEVIAIRQRGVGESLRGALDDAMRRKECEPFLRSN